METHGMMGLTAVKGTGKSEVKEENSMKKMILGIALILFGFSMAYISVQADWGIMSLASLLSVFIGLFFSTSGFIEKDK